MSKSALAKPPEQASAPVQKARPAPLRLKTLFFPMVHLKALASDADPADSFQPDLSDVEFGFRFELSGDGREATAGMRFKSKEIDGKPVSDVGYEVDMEAFAAFTIESPDNATPMALYLRKFAAAAALLGAIREQVAMTTARGPWGTINIPIVSMDLIIGRPPTQPKPGSAPPTPAPAAARRKKTVAG